jgi:hypothetical protein
VGAGCEKAACLCGWGARDNPRPSYRDPHSAEPRNMFGCDARGRQASAARYYLLRSVRRREVGLHYACPTYECYCRQRAWMIHTSPLRL